MKTMANRKKLNKTQKKKEKHNIRSQKTAEAFLGRQSDKKLAEIS